MNKSFEYIIVGAGSAGCVLANRLSEDPDCEVLLIEAGGKDADPLINIPGAYVKLFRKKIDWQFHTVPQKHVNGREIYLPRGKTLGGSSSTNAMAYVRGNKRDYDHWAALGNRGWEYEAVKHYFLKSEHHEHADVLDAGYHGTAGPLNVTLPQHYKTPYAQAFIEAGEALGIPRNQDYNGERQEGIGRFQFTIKNAQRNSAATAFLKPARARKNLTILTMATVAKINLSGNRATSAEVLVNNQKHTLEARKEVILSAGAFGSPQLLMLSGIGDPEKLAKHGIEALHDLPGVGQNLQDHLFYPISCTTKTKEGINHGASMTGQVSGTLQYLFKKGVFTIGPLEAVAFLNLDDFKKTTNFQFHFAPLHIGKQYGQDPYNIKTYVQSQDGFTILPSLLHPKSRGSVALANRNPHSAPIIDPNFLAEKEDLDTLIKGGKLALEMAMEKAFDPYRDEVVMPPTPLQTDEAWAEHIRKTVETIYHPVGTCKMGSDEAAVVDDGLKVHGIESLRVIDASIMPTIVSGNTNAPVYMIAEKGADLIKSAQ